MTAHRRSDPNTPGAESAGSHMSERAAAIEAAALEVAAQLAEKQRELNRRRRAAALAAKAALVEQMKASIAEIDTEILVCVMLHTGTRCCQTVKEVQDKFDEGNLFIKVVTNRWVVRSSFCILISV